MAMERPRGIEKDLVWEAPPRIGVGGPRAEAWTALLRTFPGGRRARTATEDAEYDLVICDGVPDHAWRTPVALIVGVPADIVLTRPFVIWASIPADGVDWWDALYQRLASGERLDSALAALVPGSEVHGASAALTAIRAESWRPVTRAQPPVHTAGGGAPETKPLPAPPPSLPDTVELDGPTAAPIAPTGGDLGAGPEAPDRRLQAFVTSQGVPCDPVAPPNADLVLEILIDEPQQHAAVAPQAFPVPAQGGDVIELDVTVTSAVWAEARKGTIQLPRDPSLASTSVQFEFRSPAAGSAVRFDVVVSASGRALQTMILTVPVTTTVGHDAIRVLACVTTAGPEPSETLSATTDQLDQRDGSPSRDGVRVAEATAQELLDAQGQLVAAVLGTSLAPSRLDDPAAVGLLVSLARRGTQLRQALEPLGVRDEGPLGVLVRAGTRIWPYELVYAGPPPAKRARLCRHATGQLPPPDPGERCTLASTSIVCPYAFWGTYRTIVRDVELDPNAPIPDAPRRLAPSSLLFAASAIADRETPAAAHPSDGLERAARGVFGDPHVRRVTSWRAWRTDAETGPEILLLLAHCSVDRSGEAGLFIGRDSFLSEVDVDPRVLGSASPLVVLLGCDTAGRGDAYGSIPAAFAAHGAGAVVGTLTQTLGPQAGQAGVALLEQLLAAGTSGVGVGELLTRTRRSVLAQGLLLGLLLVSHGDVDLHLDPVVGG